MLKKVWKAYFRISDDTKASCDAQTTKNILFAYYWERIYTLISDAGRNNSFGVWEYFYLFCHAHTSFKSWSTPLYREDAWRNFFWNFAAILSRALALQKKVLWEIIIILGDFNTWLEGCQQVLRSKMYASQIYKAMAIIPHLRFLGYDLKHIKKNLH